MKLQLLRVRSALACLLLIPATLFAQDATSEEPAVRGRLEKRFDAETRQFEYSVVDEGTGERFGLDAGDGIDLRPYVGRRIEMHTNGSVRLKVLPETAAVSDDAVDRRPVGRAARGVSGTGRGRSATGRGLQPAQHMEGVVPGEEFIVDGPNGVDGMPTQGEVIDGGIIDGEMIDGQIVDGEVVGGDGMLYDGACHSCGQACAGTCCGACPCGIPHRIWVSGDYLLWWGKSMNTPPLVTTSPNGTPQAAAGVLGQPGTQVLFGGNILNGVRSGGRLRFGTWLDNCQWWGLEGELLGLGEESEHFNGTSTGDPILARPFFNGLTNRQDSELVAFPGVVTGTVTVDAQSTFYSAGARLRLNVCCNGVAQTPGQRFFRFDVIGGYRYLRLDEDLRIRENLTSANAQVPASFVIQDRFETQNDFHGGELGVVTEVQRFRWSLELLAKVAIGNTREQVTINGNTVTTINNVAVDRAGGLLAQRTNIGRYSKDEFTVIPEVGVNLGYQLSPRLKANFGYTFIYWSHVARPGDQIDTVVNPNLLPPETVPFTGPLRPAFAFNDTDYWAQGLNFGLNYIW